MRHAYHEKITQANFLADNGIMGNIMDVEELSKCGDLRQLLVNDRLRCTYMRMFWALQPYQKRSIKYQIMSNIISYS